MPVFVGNDNPEFQRIGDVRQRYRRQRLLLLVIFDDLGQVIIRQGIAADDQKWLGQLLFRVLDAASRAKRHVLARVGNMHTELRTVAKIIFNIACQVLHSYNHIGNTVPLEQIKNMFHDRFSGNRYHRFGTSDG